MNIIEAVNSGKPFKRSSWKNYVKPPFLNLNLSMEDLVADDWKIEPKAVPITLDQFWDAYKKAKKVVQKPESPNLICDYMAKELDL